jgi:predicted TIM-barrel fold metal-dependent hydrolase
VTTTQTGRSASIRAEIGHPVIDADGHFVEFMPLLVDMLGDVAGPKVADHFGARFPRWYALTPAERLERRYTRPPWWALPSANTLDSATSVLPALLVERMGEIGLDFAVLYPTNGLVVAHLGDEEVRRGACRGWNTYQAEVFGPHADRITGVAVVPMHHPDEALAELDHAVGTLGLRAVLMPSHVVRPIPSGRGGVYLDVFALDSPYDYEPVWKRCVELGVSPTFHSGGMGWGSRMSPTTYMYNHVGHFAAASEALAKALFFGGVTRRYPGLRFGFLEGGVGWGVDLFAALVARWEKRSGERVRNYDPDRFDRPLFAELFDRYAEGRMRDHAAGVDDVWQRMGPGLQRPEDLDDFAAVGIERAEDIYDRFVPSFAFGCEADDPMNAWAFASKGNPFGAKLRAIFSSDIGHWDVPDMTEVLEEAYELVEDDLLSSEDFRDFVFGNVARFYTDTNPGFFSGTAVEAEVAALRAG